MAKFVPASTGDPWVSGQTYRFTYTVDHVKLFGVTVPDELIPQSVREYLAKKQVDQTVTKLRDDPRFEVLSYEYYGRTFVISVIARDNPFPIGVIVGGIIALAILFGIALVVSNVEKLVEAGTELADELGPVATGALSTAALIGVGVVGYLLVRRSA